MKATKMSQEEIDMRKRRCDTPKCKHSAFLEDWGGGRHCLKDWYRSLRWGFGEGQKLYYIKTTRLF